MVSALDNYFSSSNQNINRFFDVNMDRTSGFLFNNKKLFQLNYN